MIRKVDSVCHQCRRNLGNSTADGTRFCELVEGIMEPLILPPIELMLMNDRVVMVSSVCVVRVHLRFSFLI